MSGRLEREEENKKHLICGDGSRQNELNKNDEPHPLENITEKCGPWKTVPGKLFVFLWTGIKIN